MKKQVATRPKKQLQAKKQTIRKLASKETKAAAGGIFDDTRIRPC